MRPIVSRAANRLRAWLTIGRAVEGRCAKRVIGGTDYDVPMRWISPNFDRNGSVRTPEHPPVG